MSDWNVITDFINQITDKNYADPKIEPVSGGCINQAVIMHFADSQWFVKLNAANRLEMLEAEKNGLEELRKSDAFIVPEPLGTGLSKGQCFLVMEAITFGQPKPNSSVLAGRALAQLHEVTAERYGWWRDNTIGSTNQANQYSDSWLQFFSDQRLAYQLKLAASNGYTGDLQRSGDALLLNLDKIIDHEPEASLLHGDLWGGNMAYCQNGQPIIFDPAVYYGDAEADLAMTELFGGFDQNFYAAYRELRKVSETYSIRKKLYNVYHIINHLNMFGGAYLSQSQQMMDDLLADIR